MRYQSNGSVDYYHYDRQIDVPAERLSQARMVRMIEEAMLRRDINGRAREREFVQARAGAPL